MIYLALGAALLWFLLWAAQKSKRPILKFRQWRIASALIATLMFAAAAFLTLQGQWGKAIVLVVLGMWLSASARQPRAARVKSAPPPADAPMSLSEAYAILDLAPGATREDVQAAYTRLMKLIHPDKGGGAGLASKLNAARDRLLKG